MVITKKNLNSSLKKRKTVKKRQNKSSIDFSKVKFKKNDVLGEGAYSKVYKFRYSSKKVNNKYVVKRIKVLFLKKFLGENSNKAIKELFNNELKALIHLSKKGISPKIYGTFADIKNNKLYYVLEKLDYTLGYMLRNNLFKPYHTNKIIYLLKIMLKTKYRHTDLHIENIMFSKKENKFKLIDFGHHTELTKHDSQGYFTEISGKHNKLLIDKRKGYERAILGTSGASALSEIYKYLSKKSLKNKDAAFYLLKLQKFLKESISKKDYENIFKILNN